MINMWKLKICLVVSICLMMSLTIADRKCEYVPNSSIFDMCSDCQYNDDISENTMCKWVQSFGKYDKYALPIITLCLSDMYNTLHTIMYFVICYIMLHRDTSSGFSNFPEMFQFCFSDIWSCCFFSSVFIINTYFSICLRCECCQGNESSGRSTLQ